MESWRELFRSWLQTTLTSGRQCKGGRLRQRHPDSISPVPAQVEQLETRALLTFTYHGGALIANAAAQNVFLGTDWGTDPGLKGLETKLDASLSTMVSGTQTDGLTLAGYNVYRGTSTAGAVGNFTLDKSYPASGFGNGLFSFIFDSNGNIIGFNSGFGSTPQFTGGIADDPTMSGFPNSIQGLLQSMITSGQVENPTDNSLFMVYVEPGVIVSMGQTSPLSGQFANSVLDFLGYHGAFAGTTAGGAAINIHYAVMPFPGFPNVFPGTGGGTDTLAGAFNSLTTTASHEFSEAVTDPDVTFANSTGQSSFIGWYDDVNNGEVADLSANFVTVAQTFQLQLVEDQNNLTINPNAITHTLAAPTNLILATLSPTTGQISWTGSTLAQGYRIFSVNGSTQTQIGQVGAGVNIFTIAGVTAGSSVSYMVQAFDGTTTANSNALSGVASFAVSDFTNQAGKPVHLVVTGSKNVVFLDSTGHMSLGTFSSPTKASTPYFPGDIATFNGNTVTWSDGTVWTKASTPASKVTVTEYANLKGTTVFSIQNGTNNLAFVDGAGNTSLGTFLNPTQAVSQLYPGDTASFIANTVVWQDGSLWLQKNSAPTVLPVSNGGGSGRSHENFSKTPIYVGNHGATQSFSGTPLANKGLSSNRILWEGIDLVP